MGLLNPLVFLSVRSSCRSYLTFLKTRYPGNRLVQFVSLAHTHHILWKSFLWRYSKSSSSFPLHNPAFRNISSSLIFHLYSTKLSFLRLDQLATQEPHFGPWITTLRYSTSGSRFISPHCDRERTNVAIVHTAALSKRSIDRLFAPSQRVHGII